MSEDVLLGPQQRADSDESELEPCDRRSGKRGVKNSKQYKFTIL